MRKPKAGAVAYLSGSASNVGQDKDSDKRQRAAIAAFARANGFVIVDEYYDAAVSRADPVDRRPGFTNMLRKLAENGSKTIIVEFLTASPGTLLSSSPATTCSGHSELP